MTKQKRKSITLSSIFETPINILPKKHISNVIISISSNQTNIGVMHHIIENIDCCTMNLNSYTNNDNQHDVNSIIESVSDGLSDFGVILTTDVHYVCAKINKHPKIMAIVASNVDDINKAKQTFSPNVLCINPQNISDPLMLINILIN